jgi:uncharacterized protein (TIGR03435 family)
MTIWTRTNEQGPSLWWRGLRRRAASIRSSALAVVCCAMAGLLLIASTSEAQEDRPRPPALGDPAPPLALTGLLQAPPGAPGAGELSWEYFKERQQVVILEFWATWCAPCIAAIPHLNKLAEEFKDRPVVFLSITNEDEAKIRPFLEKREMKSWVGLDTSKATTRTYAVRGIPHTVLVDREGRIAGITHPNSLTAEVIENVLAGRPSGLPAPPAAAERVPLDADGGKPPVFEFTIRELEKDPGMRRFSSGPGLWEQSAATPSVLLMEAHGFYDTKRMVLPDELDDRWYSIRITYPPERLSELSPLLRQVARTAFGIDARLELREAEVLILQAPRGAGPGLRPAVSEASGSSGMPGRLTAIGQPTMNVAWHLASKVGKIVVDETGLDGRYDYELEWDQRDPQDMVRAVEEQLGLVLVAGRREVEFLVVERIGE